MCRSLLFVFDCSVEVVFPGKFLYKDRCIAIVENGEVPLQDPLRWLLWLRLTPSCFHNVECLFLVFLLWIICLMLCSLVINGRNVWSITVCIWTAGITLLTLIPFKLLINPLELVGCWNQVCHGAEYYFGFDQSFDNIFIEFSEWVPDLILLGKYLG